MSQSRLHIPDDQLLLYAAGELHGPVRETVSAHVDGCPQCTERIGQLSVALVDFSEAQKALSGAALRPGARLQLEARLTEASVRRSGGWKSLPTGDFLGRWSFGLAASAFALLAMLFAGRIWYHGADRTATKAVVLAAEPNSQLTPGAVLAASASELCSESGDAAAIPPALRARVLELYGVAHDHPEAYEVDYLITPELGGATDVRNLWPEPYSDTVWNAHVKDQLEDRLHQMVCHGDVDLATAQRAISTDWIAAYRKYFHAESPVAGHVSSVLRPRHRRLA
jgi:hypothetical protein